MESSLLSSEECGVHHMVKRRSPDSEGKIWKHGVPVQIRRLGTVKDKEIWKCMGATRLRLQDQRKAKAWRALEASVNSNGLYLMGSGKSSIISKQRRKYVFWNDSIGSGIESKLRRRKTRGRLMLIRRLLQTKYMLEIMCSELGWSWWWWWCCCG